MIPILYGITSGAILLLTLLILTNPRKVNKLGNRWLVFFLFSLFFFQIDAAFLEGKVYQEYPHLWGLDGFFIFTSAPVLYFCVLSYISPQRKFRCMDFVHFLPTILFSPLLLLSLFISTEEKLKEINEISLQVSEPDILFYVIWLQSMIYLIISLKNLQKHQKDIEIFASDIVKIDLNWLRYFLIGIGSMLFLWLVNTFNNGISTSILTAIGYFIGVCILGFFSLRQEEIFPFEAATTLEIKNIIEENEQPLSTKTQRIPEVELAILKEKLSLLMTIEKPYLDENLSLPKLAKKMGISVHNLSYLLNEGFDVNFFQFVNRYRIEEAKRILLSPEHAHLSMIGIAFECGFNSKTTFNTTFKKITGVSPSAFVASEAIV
jgi:AraC-like DNA-binding protein